MRVVLEDNVNGSVDAVVASELLGYGLVVGDLQDGVVGGSISTKQQRAQVSGRQRNTDVGLNIIEQCGRAQRGVGRGVVANGGRVGEHARVGRQADNLSGGRVSVHGDPNDILGNAKVGQIGGARGQNLLGGVIDERIRASRGGAD